MTFLLQIVTVIGKCVDFTVKCDSYYKTRRLLQNVSVCILVHLQIIIFIQLRSLWILNYEVAFGHLKHLNRENLYNKMILLISPQAKFNSFKFSKHRATALGLLGRFCSLVFHTMLIFQSGVIIVNLQHNQYKIRDIDPVFLFATYL